MDDFFGVAVCHLALKVREGSVMTSAQFMRGITSREGVSEFMMKRMQKWMRKRSGQSLVEYALILALISVVAILVLQGIGRNVNTKLGSVNTNLG
jgi:pilus assembly protein Flp/PilA